MKGILRKSDKSIFRVNTNFYPKKLVIETFGEGKFVEEYIVYELKLSEKEIYEKFMRMLEELT